MKNNSNVAAFCSGMMSGLEKKAQGFAEDPKPENYLADTSAITAPEKLPGLEEPEEEKQQEYQDIEMSPDEFYQLMHMLQYYQ